MRNLLGLKTLKLSKFYKHCYAITLPAKESVDVVLDWVAALMKNKTDFKILRISFWTFWMSALFSPDKIWVQEPLGMASLSTSNDHPISACFQETEILSF